MVSPKHRILVCSGFSVFYIVLQGSRRRAKKSPWNFEESPYVTAHVFSALVIYENVDIVDVFIEIYRIKYFESDFLGK